jgi:hypothetical protein
MSGLPTVNHVRRVLQLATGDVRYEVTAHIVSAGDLPFPQLFVVSVTDADAEKTDVLARVVTPLELREDGGVVYVKADAANLKYIAGDPFVAVADVVALTALPRDRTTAIRRGSATYLTTTVTLLYTTVTAAEAAYRTLNARLSQLVLDWRKFRTAFATNPSQDYTLPQLSVSVEDDLTKAFAAAKKARLAAEAKRDDLQTQKNACAQQDAANSAVYDLLAADIEFLTRAKQRVQATTETGNPVLNLAPGTTVTPPTGYTLGVTFNNVTRAFCVNASDAESYEALLVQKRAKLDALAATLAAHDAACGLVTRQLLDAQNAVNAARTVENTSLATLLAVCPTFDASTVNP